MASVSNYITTNNLPCKVYLDFLNPDSYTLTPNSFTVKNYAIQNSQFLTQYNFTQTDITKFPSITIDGVSFTGLQHLYPINNNLFNSVRSYSFILISKGDVDTTKSTALFISKLASKPDLLDFYYLAEKPKSQFSILNVNNYTDYPIFSNELQTVAFTHYIKEGKCLINIDQSTFVPLVQVDKGYLLNNFPNKFYLGNSDRVDEYFKGNMQYFLLFTPAISYFHLENMIDILLRSDFSWNNLTTVDWDSITTEIWDNLVLD